MQRACHERLHMSPFLFLESAECRPHPLITSRAGVNRDVPGRGINGGDPFHGEEAVYAAKAWYVSVDAEQRRDNVKVSISALRAKVVRWSFRPAIAPTKGSAPAKRGRVIRAVTDRA